MIIEQHGVQLIHIRSYPPMQLGLRLKKEFSIPLIFDMRGFYADERIEGDIWNIKNPFHRLAYDRIKSSEFEYFKQSDHIISLTHKAAQYLVEENGTPADKITVIPCCADFDHFKLKEMKGPSSTMNILYLGSLGTWYLIPEMLQFFASMKSVHPESILHVVTGDDPGIIDQSVSELSIDPSSVRTYSVERMNVPRVISEMDLSIFFIKESFSKMASSPTKLAEILACGVPVLCNSGVGDLEYLGSTLYGMKTISLSSIPTFSFSDQLEQIAGSEPERIRKEAEKLFSLDLAIEKYSEVYQALLPD